MPSVRPFRCFNSRLLMVSLLSALLIVGFAWAARGTVPRSAPRLLASLGQAAAFAWLVIEMMRSVRALDELEQRINYEAMAGAGAFTVAAIGGWGFLVKAGFPPLDWAVCALPVLSLAWALGVAWISRRYR